MRILGIETSCDETAASIVEANPKDSSITLLSNTISTSMGLHAKTGGIIPEFAARQQIKYIIPVIDRALSSAHLTPDNIDAIAVTYGPGLIGSLLVGVETAKTLAYTWRKPLIPINHLVGHIYANWLMADSQSHMEKKTTIHHTPSAISFPALALIVSGGHTDLVVMKNHGNIQWIGGTRDDAAGEAFDKIGRLLSLPYPAGPTIERLAKKGDPKTFAFPRPMIGTPDFDFSFSGLKTAAFREINAIKKLDNKIIADLAASVQQAILDVIIKKTLKATEKYQVKSILLSGGVSANETLANQLREKAKNQEVTAKIFVPKKSLCTDNATMIASAAFFNYKEVPWQKITADPELYFD